MLQRILQARRLARHRDELNELLVRCHHLVDDSARADGVQIADQALREYRCLDEDQQLAFFSALAQEFEPDPQCLLQLARQYAKTTSPTDLIALSRAAEPPRQELIRQLNRSSEGTVTIVAMRARLLELLPGHPELAAVDADIKHQLESWFSPGLLSMNRVDWGSSAELLDKLILHESVHRIDGWSDMRRRLQPDRRCFALFHPAMPDEPLVFVEVALLAEMPESVAPLLDRRQEPESDSNNYRVAAMYSISSCQPGLAGLDLGKYLIRQVAHKLQLELPRLKLICTLSPIAGFTQWLQGLGEVIGNGLKPAQCDQLNRNLRDLRGRHGSDLSGLQDRFMGQQKALRRAATSDSTAQRRQGQINDRVDGRSSSAATHEVDDLHCLRGLAAAYLLSTTPKERSGTDPIARFHLNNGARLERINTAADESARGIRQSLGVMVNYVYDLDEIARNHHLFINGSIQASRKLTAN